MIVNRKVFAVGFMVPLTLLMGCQKTTLRTQDERVISSKEAWRNKKNCPDKSQMIRVYEPNDFYPVDGNYEIYCSVEELTQKRKSLLPKLNK